MHLPPVSQRGPQPHAPQPNGHLVGFRWLGWIAVAGGLLSILLAHTVHMNDTGAVSPLTPATKTS